MANLENLTIMLTDIVGFSDLTANLPRRESQKLMSIHDRVLKKVIKRFGGRIIKCMGDSFLVVFRSPTDAVLCGMAIQDSLWEENQGFESETAIEVRVALNTGEVRLTKNDVFGDAVNIAARLESVTPANEVYLTEAVYLSMSRSEAILEKVGPYRFKGVQEEVNVFRATQISFARNMAMEKAEDSLEYPFGGAHIYHQVSHNPHKNLVNAGLIFSLVLSAMLATWWATKSFDVEEKPEKIVIEYTDPEPEELVELDILSDEFIVTSQLKQKSQPLLEANDYSGLENLVEEHKAQYAENAYLILLQAHVDMHRQRYQQALANYELAFNDDPALASTALSVKNLLTLLEIERRSASVLIARNLNTLLIQKLGERTGKSGLTGRYDAFYLLRDSNNLQAVDVVGLNIWDLRELDKCDLKKVAVVELKRLQDPRALDALNEALNVGLIGRFKYSCLRKDAKEAIALIEAKMDESAG